jgi:hypothetical protein
MTSSETKTPMTADPQGSAIAYLIASGVAGALVVLFLTGFSPTPAPMISPQESLVPGSEIT